MADCQGGERCQRRDKSIFWWEKSNSHILQLTHRIGIITANTELSSEYNFYPHLSFSQTMKMQHHHSLQYFSSHVQYKSHQLSPQLCQCNKFYKINHIHFLDHCLKKILSQKEIYFIKGTFSANTPK